MNRRAGMTLIAVAALVAFSYWVSTRTYWANVQIPIPPKGEARTNPSYAAERLVARLGAHAIRDRVLVLPPASSVIVLSAWNWNLSPTRRAAIERWVESGGRLITDATVSTTDEFARWSGIAIGLPPQEAPQRRGAAPDDPCRSFQEFVNGKSTGTPARWLCDMRVPALLRSTRAPTWSMGQPRAGVQAMRLPVGAGSVTVINGAPFSYRSLFDGDHGWLLVTAAQLRPDDDVHFLSEADYPGILALIWQRGGPVVMLSLAAIGLLLWRGGVRMGPSAPPTSTARRSLAEQIRGSGQFAFRHDGADDLHAATVRALETAARRRIPGYALLTTAERTSALARLTGLGIDTLTDALFHYDQRRPQSLPSTVALLESARRRLLLNDTRTSHDRTA